MQKMISSSSHYLQRFNFSLFTKPNPSIHYSSLILFKPNPKPHVLFTPKSTLSTTATLTDPKIPKTLIDQIDDDDDDDDEDPIVAATPRLAVDKLFFPPETEIPNGGGVEGVRVLKGSNIVLSKYARDAQIAEAEFVKSSVKTEDCPNNGFPEFALVGRSNVGKSSLLNSLVRRKKLALTSKKPGKTQCINHFRINDSWHLVDLPGYGYASAPKDLRTDWNKFTKDYFLNRSTLVSVFLLIDASIPAKKIDIEYASWLGENQIPMTLIFTKCDKRKKKKNGGKKPEENVNDFQELIRDVFQSVPPWIMTSSVTNQGRDEILLHMAQLRNYWLKH
ncbi:hypothetical protein ACFE04_015191 [Oxalis oulophora]